MYKHFKYKDTKYKITNMGIHFEGVLVFYVSVLRQIRIIVPFNDILSVKAKQNILEKILNLHTLEIKCRPIVSSREYISKIKFEGLDDINKPMKIINKFYKKPKK